MPKEQQKMRMKRLAVAPSYCQTKRDVNAARKEAAAAWCGSMRGGQSPLSSDFTH